MSHDYLDFGSAPKNDDKKADENETGVGETAEQQSSQQSSQQEQTKGHAAEKTRETTDWVPPSSAAISPSSLSPQERQFYNLVDGPYMENLVGNRYGKYRAVWGRMFKSAGSISKMTLQPSLHIPAMLFTVFWGTYRGVWTLIGIHVVAAYLITAQDLLTNEAHFLRSCVIGLIIGLFANWLYFQKMRKEAEALQKSKASEYEALGRKSGRGSWGRMIWGVLAFYVVVSIGQRVEEKILLSMGYDVSLERVYVEPYMQMLEDFRARQYQRNYYR